MTTCSTVQNTASTNSPNNTSNRSVPPTVTLQSLPVLQFVFRSNSNNSVNISDKHNSVNLTTEHIRYLVSNQGSPVTDCRDNFTFCTTEQLNCTSSCCAVCHNICYSCSQSVATFSTTQKNTVNNLNFIFHSNHSVFLFRYFYVLLAIRVLMSCNLNSNGC